MLMPIEPYRILIVDDTPENMEIIGKLLESEGYDLYLAENGQSALVLAQKVDFDLILLDIMMPELDGFQTYSEIKKLKPLDPTPVIFLTAKVDIESVIKGFEIGGADYVRKPFNGLELKARVKYQLQLRSMRQEIAYQNRCLQEANQKLQAYATTDPLTQLFNRRKITELIQYEMERSKRNQTSFSIMIGDIDHFKNVNDSHGHSFGDFVLEKTSRRLIESVRSQDSVARWGGEEFLILMPETDAEGAGTLAEKLRAIISETAYEYSAGVLHITMTFGVCSYNGTQSFEQLVKCADDALYYGKEQGRNRVILWNENIAALNE